MDQNVENSFQLEQDILACWQLTADIQTLYEAVCDKNLCQDEVINVLLGLKSLYNLKFEKLFATFETLHKGVCEQSNNKLL